MEMASINRNTALALSSEEPILSLELPNDQTFDDWLALGRSLAGANKVMNWWIGDWWAAGSHRYGERAKAAAEGIFGRDYNTLSDYASVCRSFEVTRRRVSLSFTHHREVAALAPDKADKLLDKAERENLSTRDLRAEVILLRDSRGPAWFEPHAKYDFDRNVAKEAIFQRLSEAAELGELCPKADDLVEITGVGSVSTTVDLMHVLEVEKRIEVTRFQRGRVVKIIATGQTTAEPEDRTPHWRERTESCPAPAIHQIRERAKPLAQMIEAKARSLGKPLHEFLIDCVYVGFNEIMHEAQEA